MCFPNNDDFLLDNFNNTNGRALDIDITAIISVSSASVLLLALSYIVCTLVITALVRGKAKIQRELKQARDVSNTRACYEEIYLNVVTEDNIAYGRVH